MSLDVKVDERGFMSFKLSLNQRPVDWSTVPQGKAVEQAVKESYILPQALVQRIKNNMYFNETFCGYCIYGCTGLLCCCIPFYCFDRDQWDNDRDPDLVRQEVVKLMGSLQIAPDDYRIVENIGNTDSFRGGRTILKLHFNNPHVREL